MRRTDLNRIFERVKVTPAGCWEYQRAVSARGYGVVSVKNKATPAHRVAYRLRIGEIPAGMCVLHRCDNRKCINPNHLLLGTFGENNADRKHKGRNANRRGEKNTMARLRPSLIHRIRTLYASGLSQAKVGRRFGICQQHVSQIVREKCWRHL